MSISLNVSLALFPLYVAVDLKDCKRAKVIYVRTYGQQQGELHRYIGRSIEFFADIRTLM